MIDNFKYAVIELRTSGQFVLYKQKTRQISLPYLQRVVDGHIEIVRMRLFSDRVKQKPILMVVNEEGLLKDLPVNHKASLLCGYHIVGNVVIGIRDTDPEPDIYAMPVEEAVKLYQYLKDFYLTMLHYD